MAVRAFGARALSALGKTRMTSASLSQRLLSTHRPVVEQLDLAFPEDANKHFRVPAQESSEFVAGYDSFDTVQQDDRQPIDRPDPTGRNYAYLMSGTSTFLYASFARVSVVKFLATWSAAADVIALASVEIDISKIEEGTSVTAKWRGKPVFIWHRDARAINLAKKDDKLLSSLRDPELDKDRVQDEKWLIVLGICTHLGCVPLANAGEYGGYFCPCHGSHYDSSGRIREGPAPLNLEVPTYTFLSPTKIKLG